MALALTPLPLHLAGGSGHLPASPGPGGHPPATIGTGHAPPRHGTAGGPVSPAVSPRQPRHGTAGAPISPAASPRVPRHGTAGAPLSPAVSPRVLPHPITQTETVAQSGSHRIATRHQPRPDNEPVGLGSATAHATGDPGDTISDYQFSPGTVTIHAGDTITWTNNGPSAHTATASNGSFDTGVLQKGASASHTFTQAGTFSYFCRIHPFMHGTVIVLASTSTTTPTHGSSPSSTTPASTTTPAATAPATTAGTTTSGVPTLPMTGLTLTAPLLCGIALLAGGLALRGRRRDS